ncbi:Crotonase core [Penicillium expansum]|nr:Crotonase core [Penicillium expansum]
MAEYDGVNTDTSSYSGISVITINRPDRKNAVDPLTAKALYQAILRCAVKQRYTWRQPPTYYRPQLRANGSLQTHHKKTSHMFYIRLRRRRGLELSLLADMRVVEEDAVFGVFCRRWGVPLIDGGTVRLQAIVGLGRALDMVLTGRPVSAQEALTMGLASRLVPKGESLKEAIRIARQLITFPELCLNTDRQSCYYSAYEASSFQDAISQEFNAGSKVISQEAIAGAAKFSKGSGRHGSFKDHNKL